MIRPALKTLANLSPTCIGASRLASDAMERRLTASERMGLQLHLVICASCRRYHRSLPILRQSLRESGEATVDDAKSQLSDAGRERIAQNLSESIKNSEY